MEQANNINTIISIIAGCIAIAHFIWAWRRKLKWPGPYIDWLRRIKESYPFLIGIVLVVVVVVFAIFKPIPIPSNIIDVNPAAFETQDDEFIFDTRNKAIPGLPKKDGVDLSNYDLEFTFQGGDGREVQLWYKDSKWKNIYSVFYTIQSGQSIRYNPHADGRAVDQFNDFTNIYAIGAKIEDGVEGIQITSVRLIKRD